MDPTIAFFNIDTQQPSEDGRSLVFRPRVAPIADTLAALLDFAARREIVTLATACVNAAPVRDLLGPEGLFIPIDADPRDWHPHLHAHRLIWLEKRSCGSPELNRLHRAYDIFVANPHITNVLATLAVRRFALFGDAVSYCVRSVAEGLLRAGYRVTLVADALGNGTVDDSVRAATLADLARQGARITTASDLIWELGG